MGRLSLAPLTTLKVSTYRIPRHNRLPNTSIQDKPLLIYHSCFPPSTSASDIENHLKAIGTVVPQWRYTMYSTTHFHSTTHEVLCVFSGHAKLCFGGEENEGRVETEVRQGDVIIVPAGVGHRLLKDLDDEFEMVGSYPEGKTWDMCYGAEGEEDKTKAIAALSWFEQDPLYGESGPTLQY